MSPLSFDGALAQPVHQQSPSKDGKDVGQKSGARLPRNVVTGISYARLAGTRRAPPPPPQPSPPQSAKAPPAATAPPAGPATTPPPPRSETLSPHKDRITGEVVPTTETIEDQPGIATTCGNPLLVPNGSNLALFDHGWH